MSVLVWCKSEGNVKVIVWCKSEGNVKVIVWCKFEWNVIALCKDECLYIKINIKSISIEA